MAVVAVLIIGGVIAVLILNNSNDGGKTDAEVLSLMEENHDNVGFAQQVFKYSRNGTITSSGCFDEEMKELVEESLTDLQNFYSSINNLNTNKISSKQAKDSLQVLNERIKNDMSYYERTVELYKDFYELAKQRTSEAKNRIQDNNIQNLNDLAESIYNTDLENIYKTQTNILPTIFSAFFSNSDDEETPYYRYMGDIIAELKDQGENDE